MFFSKKSKLIRAIAAEIHVALHPDAVYFKTKPKGYRTGYVDGLKAAIALVGIKPPKK